MKNINFASRRYFSEQGNVDDDATFITIFLVSFNEQSCCLMQSAVCSLRSAVCSLQMSYTGDELTEAVVMIVNSIHFNKEEVKGETKRRELNLTQAYALLWQESKDGEVDGAMELRAGAVCAAVVDLIVLDRVEIEIDQKSLLGFKYENSLLKVKLHSIRL